MGRYPKETKKILITLRLDEELVKEMKKIKGYMPRAEKALKKEFQSRIDKNSVE